MNKTLNVYRRPGLLGGTVFDDIFNNMVDFPNLVHQSTQGYPVADIYRGEEGETIMEFALAGFSRDDLFIEVKPEKKSISIRAEMKDAKDIAIRRIAKRSFNKTYVNYDNNLDLSAANAEFDNGLLRVTVPQRPEVKPVSIKIS
jgi:HSP20 family molecular chaperone IbpA